MPPAPSPELAAAREVLTTAAKAATELHASFPADRPGFGTTDYPGHAEGDVPKAYAMVLLGELERLHTGWRAGEGNLARTAGEWLLAHADSNGDGVIGWGLPVAWDAYQDGSVNPAHTEYTITTAIVIDALLTWLERDAGAPAARIRAAVAAAIAPYLEARIASPTGMAPYSLTEADRRYDTFNPAAYLAGQIQRASVQVDDRSLRARYAAAADATMRALLAHRRTAADSGHWYWNYSVQQDLPNDLPHAGYVIAGIRTYAEHGGRLAASFDWPSVIGHLHDFIGNGGELRAFPKFFAALDLPPRSYDLGFAMFLACSDGGAVAALGTTFVGAVQAYRTPQARYLKYPRGAPAIEELVVNEYEAYLYRGLTSCAMGLRAGPAGADSAAVVPLVANASTAELARHLAATAAAPAGVVPLLPAGAGWVSFDAARRASVTLRADLELSMPQPGVPVQVLEAGSAAPGTTLVFLRRHPDNELLLLRFDGTGLACTLAVRHASDGVAALRAATLHDGRLHATYYHNPSLANWSIAWQLPAAGCPVPVAAVSRLPSLEEPAGMTYEMIPSLRFHADGGGRLWLAGGNQQFEVGPSGGVTAQRITGCRHIVESAVTPVGLAHLCVGASTDARLQANAPLVVAPAGVEPPAIDTGRGVPWNLHWNGSALRIEHAQGVHQLRRLLRRDLAQTAPGGWLEFGINNDEGRIPWSQIYYLNGLLDLLDLARRDAQLLELFGPLLPEVRRRLDLEMAWLDEHVAAGRYRTRAFTVDRSPALFAVQTSRLLLLLHRYRTELPGALDLASYGALRSSVQGLHDHIEVLANTGEEERWIRPGRYHLRWPRGSKFVFDGMPVPFNHQNEWAHAVLATAGVGAPPEVTIPAIDVIDHFIERIAPEGRLPESGSWDYWWGRAYDGWTVADGYSIHTPSYAGDHIKAWISFRTIDALALVSGTELMGDEMAQRSRASVAQLAARGQLYPFANRPLVDAMAAIHLGHGPAAQYARVSSPWELANAPWSLARLLLERARLVPPAGPGKPAP
ncbi:MAG: hypothetical protein JNJ89_10115 [Rubrivivax sp.]|nr:hypothetical protein [Rubrivivax sp.]